MIYVVTGHMRHGTSAMMGALIAGGMDAYYDRDRMRHLDPRSRDEHYRLNEEVYEPSSRDFAMFGFPRMHDGRLIKVLSGGLSALAPAEGGYRYVLMRRHPEEARQSHEGGFAPVRGHARAWFLQSEEAYRRYFALVLDHLHNRRDTHSVHEVRFREDLVAEPERVFRELQAAGWPIADVTAAAAHIEPGRVRFRAEELEVGI